MGNSHFVMIVMVYCKPDVSVAPPSLTASLSRQHTTHTVSRWGMSCDCWGLTGGLCWFTLVFISFSVLIETSSQHQPTR